MAYLNSLEAMGHIDLLPSFQEEEEVHQFEADHIDLQPHPKVVVVVAAAAVPS